MFIIKLPYIAIYVLKKPNKATFQIHTPDLLFQCLDWNVRLKCTTSGPDLALAVSWVISAVYLPTHSGSGRGYYSELSTAQTLCACYFHRVMHLETSLRPGPRSARPGPARLSPQNILSQLTSPELMKPPKRTTTISSQCKTICKSIELFCHSLGVLKTSRTKNLLKLENLSIVSTNSN